MTTSLSLRSKLQSLRRLLHAHGPIFLEKLVSWLDFVACRRSGITVAGSPSKCRFATTAMMVESHTHPLGGTRRQLASGRRRWQEILWAVSRHDRSFWRLPVGRLESCLHLGYARVTSIGGLPYAPVSGSCRGDSERSIDHARSRSRKHAHRNVPWSGVARRRRGARRASAERAFGVRYWQAGKQGKGGRVGHACSIPLPRLTPLAPWSTRHVSLDRIASHRKFYFTVECSISWLCIVVPLEFSYLPISKGRGSCFGLDY